MAQDEGSPARRDDEADGRLLRRSNAAEGPSDQPGPAGRSKPAPSVANMLEAVRDRVRNLDLKQVNRVLVQPHWRREQDIL